MEGKQVIKQMIKAEKQKLIKGGDHYNNPVHVILQGAKILDLIKIEKELTN